MKAVVSRRLRALQLSLVASHLILVLGSAPGLAQDLVNLGLAGNDRYFALSGEAAAFLVNEKDQGFQDLNGDSDTDDDVLHVVDLSTGVTRNTGLAMTRLSSRAIWESCVAVNVSESDQGGTDLNGDGDATDHVWHVVDAATGQISNLGLSHLGNPGTLGEDQFLNGFLAFRVWEVQQSEDLNGDSDTDDIVPFVYDCRDATLTNLQGSIVFGGDSLVAGGRWVIFETNGTLHAHDTTTDTTSDLGFYMTQLEVARTGSLILGDTGVATVYDLSSGLQTDLAAVLQVSLSEPGRRSEGGVVAFRSGGFLHIHDSSLVNTLLPTGPASADKRIEVADGRVVVAIGEGDSALDLNGDGDVGVEHTLHVCTAGGTVIQNLMLATSSTGFHLEGDLLAFPVFENLQGGTDLNGDGDTLDAVLHVHDLQSGLTTNLQQAVIASNFNLNSVLRDGIFSSYVIEAHQGSSDLNDDGDSSDRVAFSYDHGTGTVTNTGLAVAGTPLTAGGILGVSVSEESQGLAPLNIEPFSDLTDDVFHILGMSCTDGAVDAENGAPVEILRINGGTGTVAVSTSAPIEIAMDSAPAGPASGLYVLWVWFGSEVNRVNLVAGTEVLGCTINPTPIQAPLLPQPFKCLRSSVLPGAVCAGVDEITAAPARTPWTITRNQGVSNPGTFQFQGILKDRGATSSLDYSVTNVVTLVVQ